MSDITIDGLGSRSGLLDPAYATAAAQTDQAAAAGQAAAAQDSQGAQGSSGSSGQSSLDAVASAFRLNSDDFLKIFVAQFSNQDPTKPVDDAAMMAQFAQLTQVAAAEELTRTLAGAGIAQASSFIGKQVTAAVGDSTVSGVVDHIEVQGDQVYLSISDQLVPLSSVTSLGEASAD